MVQNPQYCKHTAQLGSSFFQHAHAYAIHIVNSCPAKNVTDKDGNPTTPPKTLMAENHAVLTPVYLDAQSTSNVMNQLSATS
jgi:hypothetical protein